MKFYKLVSVCTALILSCSSTIFNFKADAQKGYGRTATYPSDMDIIMLNGLYPNA